MSKMAFEFEDAVQRLIKFPKAGHPYLHQTKRIFLNRFPYAIVYKVYREKLIMVFAIMHMNGCRQKALPDLLLCY